MDNMGIRCSLFFVAMMMPLIVGSTTWEWGVGSSAGLHANLFQQKHSSYQSLGRIAFSTWARISSKTAAFSLEPSIGIDFHDYRYSLIKGEAALSNKITYVTLGLDGYFPLGRNKRGSCMAGLTFMRYLSVDFSVVEREQHGLNLLLFSNELGRIDEEMTPAPLLAGLNMGYFRTFPKLAGVRIGCILQQAIVDFFQDDVLFSYSINRAREQQKEINGKPTSFTIAIRYPLIYR
jgi:hypothetical protein